MNKNNTFFNAMFQGYCHPNPDQIESKVPVYHVTIPYPSTPTDNPMPVKPIPVNVTSSKPYTPIILDPSKPRWIKNNSVIEKLDKMFMHHGYDMNNGYRIDTYGEVVDQNFSNAGVISAAAIAYDEDNGAFDSSFAHIVNTEDAGLRYVHCCESGKMLDLGPVEHTCFLGNCERAEGIYIPLSNTKAMIDGVQILEEIINDVLDDKKNDHSRHIKTDENPSIEGNFSEYTGNCSNCSCHNHK